MTATLKWKHAVISSSSYCIENKRQQHCDTVGGFACVDLVQVSLNFSCSWELAPRKLYIYNWDVNLIID